MYLVYIYIIFSRKIFNIRYIFHIFHIVLVWNYSHQKILNKIKKPVSLALLMYLLNGLLC